MPGLTQAQLQLLKAEITGDPVLNAQPNTNDGNDAIANGSVSVQQPLNAPAAPAYWVWRTAVSREEYLNTTGPSGSNFLWAGNGFISRTVGEQNAWRELFGAQGVANPSRSSIRQAFLDIFSGTGNAASNRDHLRDLSRRQATRGERVLATTGTGTTANPATTGYEGPLTYDDVAAARNLP